MWQPILPTKTVFGKIEEKAIMVMVIKVMAMEMEQETVMETAIVEADESAPTPERSFKTRSPD